MNRAFLAFAVAATISPAAMAQKDSGVDASSFADADFREHAQTWAR